MDISTFCKKETNIPTIGNEYFRHQFAKPLSGKGFEPIFPPYNIIIIERKYYYNRPFLLRI